MSGELFRKSVSPDAEVTISEEEIEHKRHSKQQPLLYLYNPDFDEQRIKRSKIIIINILDILTHCN